MPRTLNFELHKWDFFFTLKLKQWPTNISIMNINFKNKIVLVTGSTRNIGKCIAENFAKSGATVIINSRHRADILCTVKEFKNKRYKCFGVAADVSRPKEVQAMADKIINRYKKIDILINNAAIWLPTTAKDINAAENISAKVWRKILGVNLTGTFNCCKAVFPMMKKKGGGKIINIGSDSIKSRTLRNVSYVSSKFGILGLARQLAAEWGRYHININTVSLHMVDNPEMHRSDERYRRVFKEEINLTPLGRLAKPQDIANLILFLASERADFITGQNISVNGGFIFN